jgi:hypothetical protein
MLLIRRFLHWLGDTETDATIKSGLKECMRFMVFAGMSAGILYRGATDFNLSGEGLNTLLLGLMGYFGSKGTRT